VIVYIAGPMTGLPDYNYPAFRAAAAAWRVRGYAVLDPSEKFGGRTDLPYEVYARASILDMLSVDAVAVLPGWENSKGASAEVAIARCLGYPVLDATSPGPPIFLDEPTKNL